ncbi:alpha-amylase family glycosyl hydrolase [Porphyromonas sp.]|uniref:alpha-amylase family glycosyl hydrolase n=1 Tax=Porphyromonas sp. TaxID=1924944 RepID=UPI0026DD35AB|nr:alpha-amylase family glycosyl hydrolase [Porphyromonas sp.]MDO4695281.1 alpha-amylase family glycosyl hydrolase [Porphyromonas sp.]MDO4770681.1 alpha-amylase family glycosyl hydrolase [Porphyromonas sp.]
MNKSKISIYQVLPRLFGNKTGECVPNGNIKTNGVGKFSSFSSKALKSIKNLGITHIWYTGVLEHATKTAFRDIPADPSSIVKGEAGSPYAIKDYYDVSPTLASKVSQRMQEFEALIARTHDTGLGVIIDFVPNHVARTYHSDSAPGDTKDFGCKDDRGVVFSPQNDFYYIPDQTLVLKDDKHEYIERPARATGNDCFSATPTTHDWYETVKLNYGVDYVHGRHCHFEPRPPMWAKMLDILRYWAQKGVDGFRCDMAEMVPLAFWTWCIGELRKEYPHILFIAEVYRPHEYASYVQAGFDYLYDKDGLYDTLTQVLRGHRPASDITRIHFEQEHVKGHMLRFMENHDEVRLGSDFMIGDGEKAFPAMVVSALIGATDGIMTYFGQELGERGMDTEGFSGLDGRTSIFDYWSVGSVRRWIGKRSMFSDKELTDKEKRLRTKYSKLLNGMLEYEALNKGGFFDLMYANHKPDIDHSRDYFFLRSDGKETFLVVVNFAEYPRKYEITIPMHAFEILGMEDNRPVILEDILSDSRGAAMLSSHEPIEVDVPAHGAVVYRLV